MEVNEDLIIKVNEKYDIRKQIEVLIKQPDLPDGILAVNEIYAAIAMKIAKEKELKIPEDISFIGFTDGLISEFSTPTLSTVAQHGFMMGEYAAELLLDRIKKKKSNNDSFERKVISTNLKIRNSTKNII
jgi:LacI family transcriptional regulator